MSASFNTHPNCCQAFEAYVTDANNSVIFIKFAARIDEWQTISSSDFNIILSGGNPTISAIFIAGDFEDGEGQLYIILTRGVAAGETGTITYTAQGTTDYILDMAGNIVESFNLTIDNQVT